jgi:hypothetical protein
MPVPSIYRDYADPELQAASHIARRQLNFFQDYLCPRSGGFAKGLPPELSTNYGQRLHSEKTNEKEGEGG